MKKHFLAIVLILLSANSFATTLLVLGDSLTAGYGIDVDKGWVKLLGQSLPDTTVVNAGISGDTSGGGLSRLPKLLEKHQPDYVIIELGGNDGLRGYPLNVLRNNLLSIIKICRDNNAEPILFGMEIPANYGKRYAEKFAAVYPDIAEKTDVPLIPFTFSHLMVQEGMMQDDGIHPTALAQPVIADALHTELSEILR